MFVQRIEFYPIVGKDQEVRAVLEEWAKHLQGQGIGAGLSQSVFGGDGATFILTTRVEDLATLEERRRRVQSSPEFGALQGRLASLLVQRPRFELLDVLLPMPGA